MADQSADDLDYMLPANCPSPYFDTWDRHNSIAFSATKGLRNAPGENNCFVNCAVQVSGKAIELEEIVDLYFVLGWLEWMV